MRLYAQLGVEEYYLYDPTSDYLKPPLVAFQRVGDSFAPMQPDNGEMHLGDLIFLPGEDEVAGSDQPGQCWDDIAQSRDELDLDAITAPQ